MLESPGILLWDFSGKAMFTIVVRVPVHVNQNRLVLCSDANGKIVKEHEVEF